MEYANLGKMLEHSAGRYSHLPSIIFKDLRISYGDLNGAVNALANHLQGLPVKKGTRWPFSFPTAPSSSSPTSPPRKSAPSPSP